MTELGRLLRTIRTPTEAVRDRSDAIFERVLSGSSYIEKPNFSKIHPDDVEAIFDAYDELFFQGTLRKSIGKTPLTFQLSKRMTSAGGMMVHHFHKRGRKIETVRYEIKVSSTLLFQTFHDIDRPIRANGLICRNRLEALQRIVEHEIVHLAETLEWGKSSCSADRFQDIAHRFFAHTEHTHQLVTQAERAAAKYALQAGDQVSFEFEGKKRIGTINRITRRVTVLVEDPRGETYNDGKKYVKYYVPLEGLRRV